MPTSSWFYCPLDIMKSTKEITLDNDDYDDDNSYDYAYSYNYTYDDSFNMNNLSAQLQFKQYLTAVQDHDDALKQK